MTIRLDVWVGRLEKAADLDVTDTAQQGAELIRDEAKRIVPVKTGFLRDSIVVTRAETLQTGAAVRIEAQAPYARFIEFGTVHIAPRAFMRTAADTVRAVLGTTLTDTGVKVLTQ